MRNLILSIFILLFCVSTEAQIKFNYGIETGIILTRFPTTFYKSEKTFFNYSKRNAFSLPAPIIGLTYNAYEGKHFLFSLGLQYRRMNHYIRYYDEYEGASLVNDFRTNEYYQKICLPITQGIQFGKRLHPKIYIGIEPSYFLSGKIKVINFFYWDSSGTIFSGTNTSNTYTFAKNGFRYQSRFRGQLMLGFGMSITKHIEFNMAVHQGGFIEDGFMKWKYPPLPPMCEECYYNSISEMFWNREFTFTLKYYLKELYSSSPKRKLIKE